MRAATVVNLCLCVWVISVLAGPVQHLTTVAEAASAPHVIDKRQIFGGGGGRDEDLSRDDVVDNARPRSFDEFPPLPPRIATAYEDNAQTELLALSNAGRYTSERIQPLGMDAFLGAIMTYLTEERREEIVADFIQRFIELGNRGVSTRDMLEGRLSGMDLPQLEEQMAEMVRFRQETEEVGAEGQESWRNPVTRVEGEPIGFFSPFYTLTWSQDRQLILAKMRSGRFNRQQLVDYVRSQDPYLAAARESEATKLVKKTLSDYKVKKGGNRRGGFGRRLRDFFSNENDES